MAPGGIQTVIAADATTEKERDAAMKAWLDRLFFHPGMLTHQVRGLADRPELDGCAVEVLGPSQLTADGLQFPVRLRHMHASFHNEKLFLSPFKLHMLEVTAHRVGDREGDGSGSDFDESGKLDSTSEETEESEASSSDNMMSLLQMNVVKFVFINYLVYR